MQISRRAKLLAALQAIRPEGSEKRQGLPTKIQYATSRKLGQDDHGTAPEHPVALRSLPFPAPQASAACLAEPQA